MGEKAIRNYLSSNGGKLFALDFIEALEKNAIVCVLAHVSPSGTHFVNFYEISSEVEDGEERYSVFSFDWFLVNLGFAYSNAWNAIRIGGEYDGDKCYHTICSVCEKLKDCGFEVPEDYLDLANCYNLL